VGAVILAFAAFFGLGAEPALGQTSAPLEDWEGRRVVAVRVVDESGSVLASNPDDLPLRPGQVFSAEAEVR
jgi:hypothetical protein